MFHISFIFISGPLNWYLIGPLSVSGPINLAEQLTGYIIINRSNIEERIEHSRGVERTRREMKPPAVERVTAV